MEEIHFMQRIDINCMINNLEEGQSNGFKWAYQDENGHTLLTKNEPSFALFSKVWLNRGESKKLNFGFLHHIERAKLKPIMLHDLIYKLNQIKG